MANDAAAYPDVQPWSLGRTLREYRQRRGLTMRELAARADVSQPFLSKVENGHSTPSLGTLFRIADALKIPAQELLPEVDGDVQRATGGPAQPVTDGAVASQSSLLVGGPGRMLEARRLCVVTRPHDGSYFTHDGEEFVHVLTGCVEIEFADGQSELLRADESLWYRSTLGHRWTNRARHDSEVLIINARQPFVD